jgi:hypothetical protein
VLDPAKWAACEELLGHKWLGPSMYPCRSHVYFSYIHNFCNYNKDLKEERPHLFMKNSN